MTTVSIPPALQKLTGGAAQLEVEPGTLAAILERLDQQHPRLRAAVVSDAGELRRFVTVFVDKKNVRHLAGLATPVAAGSVVTILVALAGG